MPRRRTAALLLAALVLVSTAGTDAQRAAAQPRGSFTGVVTHVADGDTLQITAGARSVTVRLDGIDAPEGDQAFSQQARQRLRVLAFSQQAKVTVRDTDRYGRLVARVIVGGRDLSEEMVAAGLAWRFVRYSSDIRLAALERQARQQRLGLWADRSPVPPWQYREQRSSAPRAAPSPASPPAQASAGPYHGNVSSHVYHQAGCKDYNCRNCTQVFATAAQAEAAGYRPHTACVRDRR